MKGKKLTPAEIKEINELYQQNMSMDKIADITHFCKMTVERHIKERRPQGRPLKFSIKEIQEINKLYDGGTEAKDLAKKYNVSEGTIYNYIWHIKRLFRKTAKKNVQSNYNTRRK